MEFIVNHLILQERKLGGWEMAQWVKVLATQACQLEFKFWNPHKKLDVVACKEDGEGEAGVPGKISGQVA